MNPVQLTGAAALSAALLLPTDRAAAQQRDTLRVDYSTARCPSCADWSAPTAPRKLFGNSYYVGTRGLSAILIAGDRGHVLVDAGLPASAPRIIQSIEALGFDPRDIRLIVISHAHFDHSGGVAAIQRASGATVAAMPPAAIALERGENGADDPQFGLALPYPAVKGGPVRRIADRDTLQVGGLTLTAHATGGHTPGGTSWSWRSCEGTTCLDFVYADSQTPVSNDTFRYSDNKTYPTAVADFRRGHARLESLSCDVLLTPHPSASRMWERLESFDGGKASLVDKDGCKRLAATARQQLEQRLARERGDR